MGPTLGWLSKPAEVDLGDWYRFLDGFAPIFYLVVVAIVALVFVFYSLSARRRKIHFPQDVFLPYTPLYWIGLAVPGGIVAFVLCLTQYPDDFHGGRLSVSSEVFLMACLLIALLSYLGIVVVSRFTSLTPMKYRYRTAPFLHRRKASR